MGHVIHGTVLVEGGGSGPLLVSDTPLSFWGGYNQFTGEVIDRRHPYRGKLQRAVCWQFLLQEARARPLQSSWKRYEEVLRPQL